jgi:hypothetical protein
MCKIRILIHPSLQDLLELEYPEIRFPWKRIWREIARNIDVLPEAYEYREAEMVKRFRADREGAEYYRAGIHLNRGAWDEAVRAARYVRKLWPEMSFVAAMGFFELGRREESVADFLHGAGNYPGAAPLITGRRAKALKTNAATRDRQVGAAFLLNLAGYQSRNGPRARRFFGALTANPKFGALMDEIEKTRRRRDEERKTGARVAWDLLQRMQSPRFATEREAEIYHLPSPGRAAGSKTPSTDSWNIQIRVSAGMRKNLPPRIPKLDPC